MMMMMMVLLVLLLLGWKPGKRRKPFQKKCEGSRAFMAFLHAPLRAESVKYVFPDLGLG